MGQRKDRKAHRQPLASDAAQPVLAPDSPELRRQIAVLAGQVSDLRARAAGATAPASDPAAGEHILAAAERAAAAIRDSAQREAQRIRAGSVAAPPQDGLLAAAERQRHTLAVIAAEIERIEHGAGALRTALRSLDAELAHMIATLSGPAA